MENLRNRIVEECASANPDIIFIIKGYNINRETVLRLKHRTNAVVSNWNPDNPFQVRSDFELAETYLESLPAYDVVFTWGEFFMDRLRHHCAKHVEHLPFGYDPTLHRPTNPAPEYSCDVIFLGHWSKKRERILSHISDLDVDFNLWGNHWKWRCWNPSLRRCLRGDALIGDAYAQAMSSAKIVVNVVADHNVPAYNMRTFEIPATEAFMLTTDTAGQREIFEPGVEMATYANGDELAELIDYYLDADEEREAIARRGRGAIEGHSYRERMERVLDISFDIKAA